MLHAVSNCILAIYCPRLSIILSINLTRPTIKWGVAMRRVLILIFYIYIYIMYIRICIFFFNSCLYITAAYERCIHYWCSGLWHTSHHDGLESYGQGEVFEESVDVDWNMLLHWWNVFRNIRWNYRLRSFPSNHTVFTGNFFCTRLVRANPRVSTQ